MGVYEFSDGAVAEHAVVEHWVATVAEGAGDARQVGRFMLLWQEDSPRSAEARDELERRVRELVGGSVFPR